MNVKHTSSLTKRNSGSQSIMWSSVNPDEKNVLTATQLSVQNQKVKKDLDVLSGCTSTLASNGYSNRVNKGIEDEKRCGKAAMAKEEIMLQNRLNRLAKASQRTDRLTRASLTSVSATGSLLENSDSEEKNMGRRSSIPSFLPDKTNSLQQIKTLSTLNHSDDSTEYEESFEEMHKRNIKLGDKASSSKKQELTIDSLKKLLHSREGRFIQDSLAGPSNLARSDEKLEKRGSLPTNLDCYNPNVLADNVRRSSKGFSMNNAPFAYPSSKQTVAQSPGLEEEINRWRRHHYTRSVNARLKAVRIAGRRHTVTTTLREAMDINARMRKEMATKSDEFSPEQAWQVLNCRYLRLTPNAISTLETLCRDAGYDVSSHPHVISPDWKEVFQKDEDFQPSTSSSTSTYTEK